MKVLIDFDNTFYTDNRDVDDGLALMYLLGSPGVDLVGITSTFGNSNIKEVDRCTRRLMKDLKLPSHLYRKGASECSDYLTEASHFICEKVNQYKGEINILATGGMSNIAGAWLLDPHLFEKVNQLVLMGGTTEALIFAKQEMLELNLSVDPNASFITLTKCPNISLMTANNCLDLLFTRKQYEEMFDGETGPIAHLIRYYSDPWFKDNELEYGIKGFYNWDSLAAAYLVNPEFFEDQPADYTVSVKSLSSGSLIAKDFDPTSYAVSKPLRKTRLNLPKIKNKEGLKQHIYQTWLNLDRE